APCASPASGCSGAGAGPNRQQSGEQAAALRAGVPGGADPPQNGPWCCRHGGLWARAPRGHWMTPLLQDPATYDSRPSAPTHCGTACAVPGSGARFDAWQLGHVLSFGC
ncbi:hypothetical protein MC885_021525, partial [Smutsia gigantea]